MELGIISETLAVEKATFEIQSDIGAIESNPFLFDEENFDQRIEAIDFIEFQIINLIEGLRGEINQSEKLLLLKHRAEKLKSELEEVNITLFGKLREEIRKGAYRANDFKSLVNKYVDFNLDNIPHQQEPGYDNLDMFINGLLFLKTSPEQTKDLEPEMVFYQKTPARIIFELHEKCNFTQDDVFYDLGSGLGQIVMLVNLLSGVTTKGIEFEPAFCHYSRDCAAELNLFNLTFLNADARHATYSDGTVFFMYTPFNGGILQAVLEVLRKESLLRKIKIITYGPCALEVALQSWLDFAGTKDDNIYKLAVFTSL
jgi:hypothetical protein